MATSILSIGISALNAAQVGLSTTGHNIANASTPGYTRQVVVQGAAQAQNFGYGYVGQGTQINTIKRIYSELLNNQVISGQSLSSATSNYAAQMKQIDNLLSDTTAGLSPVVQDFFASLQGLSANPNDASARQATLSSASSLAARFHSLDGRLDEIRQGVNSQITTSVGLVNAYAKQIGQLNDVIEKATSATGNPPNDLMDQRDLLVSHLSKEIKTSVVRQDGGSYSVFVGNGLPLVVGKQTFSLATQRSPTDGTRLEVAYQTKNKSTILSADSLPGGNIGGMIQFRNNSLDNIQNQLGRIATVMAQTFNEQHQQAQDASGSAGGLFFTTPLAVVNASGNNTGNAAVLADITDAKALTTSDYRLQYDGANYTITRLDNGTAQSFASLPQSLDGLTFKVGSGAMASGDDYLIQPTANGASTFSLALSDITKIAVGSPVLSSAPATSNTGAGTITAPVLDSTYTANPLTSAVTLTYDGTGVSLSGFPAAAPITVKVGSTSTTYPAGSTVPYTAGASISFSGLTVQLSGVPNDTDQFTISPNAINGAGDNRNALLLTALQTANTMNSGTTSYSGVYGQLVSTVGNKMYELQVNDAAEKTLLTQAIAAQQSESGVNLDEEATNLLRYQQAYQAAGKMMQIASQLFDVLLNLKQ
ncbi:MAG: flagellar hook-associated protein FlgK [Methylophilaceae bacterium]